MPQFLTGNRWTNVKPMALDWRVLSNEMECWVYDAKHEGLHTINIYVFSIFYVIWSGSLLFSNNKHLLAYLLSQYLFIFTAIVGIRVLAEVTTSLENCESYGVDQMMDIITYSQDVLVSIVLGLLRTNIRSSLRLGESVRITGAR